MPCQQLWAGEGQPTIFEATVESIEIKTDYLESTFGGTVAMAQAFPRQIARLRDLRPWIGSPQTNVTTAPGGCAFSFEVGQRYLIDAAVDPSGQLVASRCSLTRPIAAASETIAYLESLSGPSPGGTLRGDVRLWRGSIAAAGDPKNAVPGVRVTAVGPVTRSTATGADGSFVLDALPPGEYTVRADIADRPGLLDLELLSSRYRLPNAHACAKVAIILAVNGVIEGSVVDQRGVPMKGASVALRSSSPGPATREQGTDESGLYRFSYVPPGGYQVGLQLDRGPSLMSPFIPLDSARPASEAVELGVAEHQTLPPIVVRRLERIQVTGRAVWANGRPAAGARLAVQTFAEGGWSTVGATFPDADGNFRIDLLESVPYFIGFALKGPPPKPIQFIAGPDPLALTLPFSPQ